MLSQLSMAKGENTEYQCLDIIMNKRFDFCTARTYDTVLSRPVVSHTTPYATCLGKFRTTYDFFCWVWNSLRKLT